MAGGLALGKGGGVADGRLAARPPQREKARAGGQRRGERRQDRKSAGAAGHGRSFRGSNGAGRAGFRRRRCAARRKDGKAASRGGGTPLGPDRKSTRLNSSQ